MSFLKILLTIIVLVYLSFLNYPVVVSAKTAVDDPITWPTPTPCDPHIPDCAGYVNGSYTPIPTPMPTGQFDSVIGKIDPPTAVSNIGLGAKGLNQFINTFVKLIYFAATIIFVFMILYSALQWILSGGDKEKLSSARTRLTQALIGIFLLAIAFVAIKVFGQVTGFEFFTGQNIEISAPAPTPCVMHIPGEGLTPQPCQ